MNKATFLAVQLNVDDIAASPGLVELLNTHLVFAADVAEAADALVQVASIAGLSSGVEASVEIPAVAIERLREALDNLSGYDESWLLALEPSRALFDDIGRRQRTCIEPRHADRHPTCPWIGLAGRHAAMAGSAGVTEFAQSGHHEHKPTGIRYPQHNGIGF